MRRILLLLTGIILSFFQVLAQNPFSANLPKTPDGLHKCYTDQLAHENYEKDPDFRRRFSQTASDKNGHPISQRFFSDSVIRIPVVVHVVHNGGSSNISKAQIESQIRILNEDFRRLPGTNGFGPGADTKFEFFLVQIDENGNCTDGIYRYANTGFANHSPGDGLKNAVPNWNPTKYLNIWVVNSMGGILGYATLPSSLSGPNDPNDGVVIADQYFGDQGTSGSGSFGFGRTATHEVGHWLGLLHPFQGGCNGGDFVADTPPVDNPNFGCAIGHVSCGSPDQVENYMDYSDDLCFDRFTPGQATRMLNRVTSFRPVLLDSMNAIDAGLFGCDVPVTAAISGNDTVCIGEDFQINLNLTGLPPFDVVYSDGINNFNINGINGLSYSFTVSAPAGITNYQIVSLSNPDSVKTAPDPSLIGTATVVANNSGPASASLSGNATICDGDTVSINFNASGGTAPFDIEVNNNVGIISGLSTSDVFDVSPEDSSTFQILSLRDANGCGVQSTSSSASYDVLPSPTSFFLKSINKGIVTFNNSTVGASTYAWDFGDGNTSSVKNPVHVFQNTGNYLVSLTSTNNIGCSHTFSEEITISEISSISDLRAGESLELYPNPSLGDITLELILSAEAFIKWTLSDISGRIKLSEELNESNSKFLLHIKSSELSAGVYVLKIVSDDGRSFSRRLYKK